MYKHVKKMMKYITLKMIHVLKNINLEQIFNKIKEICDAVNVANHMKD